MQKLRVSVLFVALVLASAADAAGRFDNRTLKGVWSLFVQGHVTDTSPFTGTDLVAVATIWFDGHGRCQSKDQIVVDGVFVPGRNTFRNTRDPGGECIYAVNPDGTGFFNVTFPGAPVTNVTFVITDRSRVHFVASNGGLGIFGGGVIERQRRSH